MESSPRMRLVSLGSTGLTVPAAMSKRTARGPVTLLSPDWATALPSDCGWLPKAVYRRDFLHVHSSCLPPQCLFSAVQTFRQGLCCLVKGLPKPSALSCPGHRATVITYCSLNNPILGDLRDKGLHRCVVWLYKSVRPSPACKAWRQESPRNSWPSFSATQGARGPPVAVPPSSPAEWLGTAACAWLKAAAAGLACGTWPSSRTSSS